MAHPVGEENWLAYLEETSRNASNLEERVEAVELYKLACNREPGSLRLYLAFCNYFRALYEACRSEDDSWTEEERLVGGDIFTIESLLQTWQEGYNAIKFRLNDSHKFWNAWIALETEQLSGSADSTTIEHITNLYNERLLIPHLAWEETASMFSGFLTTYNQAAWEGSMKEITERAQDVKKMIAARDPFELKLKEAATSGDIDVHKSAFRDYLEWEQLQSRINMKKDKSHIGAHLCQGLFDRALTGVLASDESTWLDYAVFVPSLPPGSDHQSNTMLDVLSRAVRHCSFSGLLWSRYILEAEAAGLEYEDVAAIKQYAHNDDQLTATGMENLLEMYVTWCGYLKRTVPNAEDKDKAIDIADAGITAALEDVAAIGQRLFGQSFQGDPNIRLERVYIQYLLEKNAPLSTARAVWKRLAKIRLHADNHNFWLQYYHWEMSIWSSGLDEAAPSSIKPSGAPSIATQVLEEALHKKTLDWPEKIIEVYMHHCNIYEASDTLCKATNLIHKISKGVQTRRLREANAVAAYNNHYTDQSTESANTQEYSPNGAKRKRDAQAATEIVIEDSVKRRKGNLSETEQVPAHATSDGASKRDRENSTVIVRNLPPDITQTKIRQYFREYGHINGITAHVIDQGGQASTALIEFRTTEEAQSALLRDGKYLNQSQLKVQPGFDLTLFVSNYPPTADEAYIRELFKDCGRILSVRLPSLKVNTHRRFCYVSFDDREGSAKAVQKDGKVLENGFKLTAKYSNPGQKKRREGAVAEGREIHIVNIDRSASEDEIRQVFSKYGKITRVNMPRNMAGKTKGFAYLDFETKEQASEAAAQMNRVKLRSQVLEIEVSKDSKLNPTAKVRAHSASPAPSTKDKEDDETMSDASHQHHLSRRDIDARTICLKGLPDTVNDARVQALLEPLGRVVQLTLQPSHGSAKIEFADQQTAGSAALKLNSMEFEGNKLWTEPLNGLRQGKANPSDDPNASGLIERVESSFAKFAPRAIHSRPNPRGNRGGPRRGLGFAPRATRGGDGETKAPVTGEKGPKSNADFKALFLSKSNKSE